MCNEEKMMYQIKKRINEEWKEGRNFGKKEIKKKYSNHVWREREKGKI